MVDLREEVELLREQVRQLEAKFRIKERVLYRGLDLSRNELFLVDALVKATGVVSGEWLEDLLEMTPKALVVTISRLRRKFKKLKPIITVVNVSGEGYHLRPEDRVRLTELNLSTAG